MRKFYIISALQKNKYELFAAESEHGILVIDEIIKYSGGIRTALSAIIGQTKRITENIIKYQKEGVICLVEEVVPEYAKYAANRSLNDPVDGRNGRDVYFEHVLALHNSGKLVIPDKNKTAIPSSKTYSTKVNDSGKITYQHRSGDINGELRAILLLVSAHKTPPMTIQWLSEYNDAIGTEPKKLCRTARIAKALTVGAEENQYYAQIENTVEREAKKRLAKLFQEHNPIWVDANLSKWFTPEEIELIT